ncbi:hypothetical protein NLG97_g15 [Lecanicillium saksenae]|uniref:Uncharacterized protein n=1 Tax=Lecanicillium saksenae TaxID=468837 RepID=A0ACC1R8C6_9HYPO|nr:hypothetical protein NLG97_g15 [Lecanicillium saksenae]
MSGKAHARGGLTRASLAALRARKNAVPENPDGRGTMADLEGTYLGAESAYSTESTSPSHNSGTLVTTMLSTEVHFQPTVVVEEEEEDDDVFVRVYFKCFHRYHPCILPASRLRRYFNNPSFHQQLLPTMAVVRLIGSIYARSSRSEVLLEEAESAIAKGLEGTPRSPFLAQALLLYSVSTYWSHDDAKSRQYMDLALDTALQIGMNYRSFAIDNAPDDTVLQECFRRTWWQIYVIDAAYASIKRSASFRAAGVISDVDLPCGEDDYDRGIIPKPSTMAEFDCREFEENEKVYSSFAYLIGIIRALTHAATVGTWQSDRSPTQETVSAIDAVVDGWFLLLPESKQIMDSSDEIDELLYFATMWIHA